VTTGAPDLPDLPDLLDPLIHVPARLRLMVTLAALPRGDALSFTRLQAMLGLTPGNLTTHLGMLEVAGYVQTEKSASGTSAQATVALTHDGRAALERYTTALRQLAAEHHLVPGPDMRIGDADRDAAAAALNEHFAQGRLTLDELDARLGAAFSATTQGEISQVTWDLPDLTVLSARLPFACLRRERARRGHRTGPAASQRTPPRHRG
jgi:DNA-binding MarR family transcriptional regulator